MNMDIFVYFIGKKLAIPKINAILADNMFGYISSTPPFLYLF